MLARFECPYCHQEGWAEFEVHALEQELFFTYDHALRYVVGKVAIKKTYRYEELYREVAKFVIPRIRMGYNKNKLIREISEVFGIVEEDAAGLLERIKVEIGAYEERGKIVI